jgi:hypothetical protein
MYFTQKAVNARSSKIRNFSEKSKHFSKVNANGDEKCHFNHSYELVFSHDRQQHAFHDDPKVEGEYCKKPIS